MLEEREGRAAIDARTAASQVPFAPTSKLALEMSVPELHKGATTSLLLKPNWSSNTTKAELDAAAQAALRAYSAKVRTECAARSEAVSYFEGNIETWRQLWHVLDRLDVAFYVVDVRCAPLHFSPALYA